MSVRYREDREVQVAYEIIQGRQKPEKKVESDRIFSDNQAELEAFRCMKCGYHKEDLHKCMGCGICADVCSVKAVRLTAAGRTVQEVE